MKRLSFVLLLGFAFHLVSTFAQITFPDLKPFQCGTLPPTVDALAAFEEFYENSLHHHTDGARAGGNATSSVVDTALGYLNGNGLHIDVYFHVVRSERGGAKDITHQQLLEQFDVLSAIYKPYNVHFTLIKTTYTNNTSWAYGWAQESMGRALRQGSYRTLNIFFQDCINCDQPKGVAGLCSIPHRIEVRRDFYVDACYIHYSTLPGGLDERYNLGYTAVHEVGHWLGLLHTFEGYDCEGPGDLIIDTPPQMEPTNGCPKNATKDTCPNEAGYDPVENFMDYSYDEW
ncbi:MAG: hypothetical protein M1819_001596 [Sarea resinae]|nr:MAG: hypothetical protein M1819_001596 [Sarea resinae]